MLWEKCKRRAECHARRSADIAGALARCDARTSDRSMSGRMVFGVPGHTPGHTRIHQ